MAWLRYDGSDAALTRNRRTPQGVPKNSSHRCVLPLRFPYYPHLFDLKAYFNILCCKTVSHVQSVMSPLYIKKERILLRKSKNLMVTFS